MSVPAALSDLGPIGIRGAYLDHLAVADGVGLARRVEELGFSALWIPESSGHETFSHAAVLLGATRRIVVATGIANVHVRDPAAMSAGAHTLADAFPGRFVLGLGLGHRPMVEARGHRYGPSLTELAGYLDAMEQAEYRPPLPAAEAPRVLGALGPKMLALAAERGLGAHPYFVPVAHTEAARAILGPEPFLAPEMAVVAARTRTAARELARPYLDRHLSLDNYRSNLRRFGFDDTTLSADNDDLFDTLVAWGGSEAVRERLAAHRAAGADHVAVHPVATVGAPVGELARILDSTVELVWG